jgi:hypothetical protein
MRSVLSEVYFLGELDRGVQFFSAHRRVVETFQMYDYDFWETEDSQLFALLIHFFAFLASVATLLHFLWLNVATQAFIKADIPSDPRSFPRNWNAEVHKVVESVTLMIAAQTLDRVHKLTCEQISDYGVIPVFVILPPLFTLLAKAKVIKVHLFVRRLLENPIHFFMHAVK